MAYLERYMLDEHGNLRKVVVNAGVGFVLPFYGETAPPGTLACDGSEISRTVYDELFQVLGTKAGAGDGSTTFNLPDLRGQFVRGTGGNAAELGVEQGDAIRDLTGALRYVVMSPDLNINPENASGVFSGHLGASGGMGGGDGHQNNITFSASGSGVPTAAENRPVNVALLWCIIYE